MNDGTANSNNHGTTGMKTRATLLLRLRDLGDQETWDEFVELYGPFILRCVMGIGLQQADALDVVQHVLSIVVSRIGRFEYDSTKSFRGWLRTVASHRAYRFLSQNHRRPLARGGTTGRVALQDIPGAGRPEDELIQLEDEQIRLAELEWQRRRLELAVKRVRQRMNKETWRIVELYCVEHVAPGEIASRLGKNRGSVDTALCRFRQKVREALEQIDE